MINTEEIKIKSFNREAEGRKLVIFAWIIEVVAIVIGLSIGISAALIGIEQSGLSLMGNINFSVAAIGPFIAFAACELAKIPTAKGLYTSQGWTKKTLCLVLLSFFAVLTFETIYQGMEQNISSRISVVQQFKGELTDTQEKITTLEVKITSISEEDVISTGQKVIGLNENENEKTKLMLAAVVSKYKDSISIVEKNFDSEISLVQASINDLMEEINKLDENEQKTKGWGSRKTRSSLGQRRDPLITSLSNQRSILEKLRTDKRLELQQIHQDHIFERGPIDKKIAENRNLLGSYQDRELEKAYEIELEAENLQLDKDQLTEKAQSLREKILIAANSNAVYRIAMSFSSVEHPADLPNEIVDMVGNIWVISISVMTAVAGSVLAFVGVSMQEDRTKKSKEKRKPSKVSRAIRSMLIDARRKLRSPKIVVEKEEIEVEKIVEVIKEVPVQKVVIQEKEVEVEKVITRVIGVPVPTHPKDLPTAEEIDEETGAERLLDLQEITSIGEPSHA